MRWPDEVTHWTGRALVSAWASRQRLVLGQEAVADKASEILAIPLLLKHLELKGALVTIDAIGTQVAIARTITEAGGNYLLALKANWPALLADVESCFTDPANQAECQTFDTVDGDHGRVATGSATPSTGRLPQPKLT